MDKINEYLVALAKIPGAEDLAKKLTAEFKSFGDEHEASKSKVSTLTKERDAARGEAAKHKSDLDAGATGKDEALRKITGERDDWKKKAEDGDARYKRRDLELTIGDELGIADKATRDDAVASFMRAAPESIHLNEAGKLVGAAKAIEAFKAEKTWYFGAKGAEKKVEGNGGPRPGSEPAPLNKSGTGQAAGTVDKRAEWASRLEGTKSIPPLPQSAQTKAAGGAAAAT